MSTPSVSLAPLSSKNKKKRPSFRPQRKTKLPLKEQKEQEDVEEEEIPFDEKEEKSSKQKITTPTRKRKGVAIGSTRPEKVLPSLSAPTHVAPQLPIADTGEAKLSTYCSKFRLKRTKKDKAVPVEEKKIQPEEREEKKSTGPMVKVVNGEIVLQESSMLVDGEETKPEDEFPVVEEDAQPAVIGASYNSFVNRRKPQHWTPEETELFYEALRQVGVDFSSMEVYFKKRNRKHLKKKYQAELVKNPHLIEAALNPAAKKDIDLAVFDIDPKKDGSTSKSIVGAKEVKI